MINQHLQAAIPSVSFANAELQEFIQNPIEDIWLQAKTWVRRFCALIPSFSHLKWMFEWFIRHTTFDFATLQMYEAFSEIKY